MCCRPNLRRFVRWWLYDPRLPDALPFAFLSSNLDLRCKMVQIKLPRPMQWMDQLNHGRPNAELSVWVLWPQEQSYEPTIDSSQIIDISHPLAIQHIDSLPIKETSSQPRLFTGTGNSVDIPTSGQIKVIHDKWKKRSVNIDSNSQIRFEWLFMSIFRMITPFWPSMVTAHCPHPTQPISPSSGPAAAQLSCSELHRRRMPWIEVLKTSKTATYRYWSGCCLYRSTADFT